MTKVKKGKKGEQRQRAMDQANAELFKDPTSLSATEQLEICTQMYWLISSTYHNRPESLQLTVGSAIHSLQVVQPHISPSRFLSHQIESLQCLLIAHGQKPKRRSKKHNADVIRISTYAEKPRSELRVNKVNKVAASA